MSVLSINGPLTGARDILPYTYQITTNDSLATITTAGYLNNQTINESFSFTNNSLVDITNTTNGVTTLVLTVSSNGTITLSEQVDPGNVLLPVVSGDFAVFNGTTGQIKDAGYSASNAAKTKVVMANGAVVSGNVASYADTAGTVTDSGIIATSVMKTTAVNTMAAASSIILAKVNGTEASNAVTASGVAGVITTSSLTTAGGANYAITWTNTAITSTSVIGLTTLGGTNTTQNYKMVVVPGSGTATLTIYNLTASTAFNGTLLIGYTVF